MTSTLYIYDVDNAFVQLDSDDRGILMSLFDYFSFDVPGARHMPSYKEKRWDGKIRLLNSFSMKIYRGLLPYITEWCEQAGVAVDMDDSLIIRKETNFSIKDFIDSLDLTLTPFDYQEWAVQHIIDEKRCTILSPTSSGKSLIIYCLVRFFLEKNKKVLLTVPLISLVTQMIGDFKDYNKDFPIDDYTHCITSGIKKDTDKPLTISTWQSVYKLGKKYFSQFDVVMVDEAHHCSAESLKGILEKSVNADYRIGFTGTLDDAKCHRLVIEGLLGASKRITNTNDLTERGIISKLKINCAIVNYDAQTRIDNKNFKYHDEMKFILDHKGRNRVIKNMINNIEGNALILTAFREHIDILKPILEETGKTVYVVHGDIKPDDREDIKKRAEKEDNIILLATYGVYSTGVNIKNIQYVMFATGSKSLVRVLQSIGRGLRKDGKKNSVILLDIVDDFSFKKKQNYLLRHFFERIKIYEKENFKYKLFNIKI